MHFEWSNIKYFDDMNSFVDDVSYTVLESHSPKEQIRLLVLTPVLVTFYYVSR